MPVGRISGGGAGVVGGSPGGGPQRSPLSGRKRSFSPGPSDVSERRVKTLKSDEGSPAATSLQSQLGITQIQFESRLQTWVESTDDASEKKRELKLKKEY